MAGAVGEAYEKLRMGIISGSLAGGERLGEVDLAENLGISRTPIREALRRLASEGLVEIIPNRGARVATWANEDLDEIYRLRAHLEGYAAASAAARIDESTVKELTDLCEAMEACEGRRTTKDLDRITTLNARFHAKILDAASSPRLANLLSSVVEVPLVFRAFRRYSPEALSRSMGHHRDLVAALSAQDGAWASAVMQSHILAARSALLGTEQSES
jgi:DNA-binding GntR family transcriptional regulator